MCFFKKDSSLHHALTIDHVKPSRLLTIRTSSNIDLTISKRTTTRQGSSRLAEGGCPPQYNLNDVITNYSHVQA